MKEQLKNRTKVFAHKCVKLAVDLPNNELGRHLKSQLIRSASSVAANYRAACIAQTKKSFVAKLSIVLEEVDESNFWLEFLKDEKLNSDIESLNELMKESDELTKIFVSSRKTAQQNMLHEDVAIYE